MYYAVCERRPEQEGNVYQFYKFKSLADIKDCELVDEYSIVYNGKAPNQLAEFCTAEELAMIWQLSRRTDRPTGNKSHVAEQLHAHIVKAATLWKPEQETPTMSNVATAVELDAPTPAAVAATGEAKQGASRPRFNKAARIVCLMEEPPIRADTNRYRNMQIIMGCGTVGEAMEQLRSLEEAPGGGVDIKLAVKAGAIKLEE